MEYRQAVIVPDANNSDQREYHLFGHLRVHCSMKFRISRILEIPHLRDHEGPSIVPFIAVQIYGICTLLLPKFSADPVVVEAS